MPRERYVFYASPEWDEAIKSAMKPDEDFHKLVRSALLREFRSRKVSTKGLTVNVPQGAPRKNGGR